MPMRLMGSRAYMQSEHPLVYTSMIAAYARYRRSGKLESFQRQDGVEFASKETVAAAAEQSPL